MTKTAKVSFTQEFSAKLAGIVFEIDSPEIRVDAATGREMVGVRTRRNGRWAHRMAYVTDLVVL